MHRRPWPKAVEPKNRVIRDEPPSQCCGVGEKRPNRWLRFGLVFLVYWSGLGGCGVKGPPVPLRKPAPLPAVTDLAYRVTDGAVNLTWSLSPPLEGKAARQASFIVRRSQTALDAQACENCPQVFTTVGTVLYVDTGDRPFTARFALEAGYRYVFIVRLQKDGDVGPDSNPVKFDYTVENGVVPVEEP